MIVRRIRNARDVARIFMETGSNSQSPQINRLDSVIRIVIDSALGYTLVSFTLFLSQVMRSNALYITSGAVSLLWLIIYTVKDANTGGFEGCSGRRNRIQPY